ncbi:hypothetical protein G114_17876 [Aeromonas diversa CDC 2478-85]|uniref:DUF748 domain-containing protein n=1 Tax=Aeromonas diversa CDC 2478-85 TaxID=1268237 RepID=N9TWT6_9GAMM|nr:DUF748 domain-containing protein [Aeromonas diversa]ENY70535.1 hypothetical protein G114_17876 [Aeromonas diversa CDC 2478-85]
MSFSTLRRFWPLIPLTLLILLIWQTPALLHRYLPPWLAERTGLQLEWQVPEFGVHTLGLPALTLKDREGAPLLDWDNLSIEPAWWDSLRGGKLIFTAIRLEGADLHLVRTGDASLNLMTALAPFTGDASASPSAPSPELEIGLLSMQRGAIHYRDGRNLPKTRQDPSLTLDALDLTLPGFSLTSGAPLPYTLSARLNGAALHSQGQLRLSPWEVSGDSRLEGLSLAPFTPLWQPWFKAKITQGSLSAAARWQVNEVGWKLEGGKVQLGKVRLARSQPVPGRPDQWLDFAALALEGIKIDGQQQRLSIKRASWQRPHLAVSLDERYQPDLQALLPPAETSDKTPPSPWRWQLERLQIKEGSVDLRESSSGKARQRAISALNVTLGPLSERLDKQSQLALSTLVDNQAKGSFEGSLTLSPLSLSGAIGLDAVPLGWAQAYLQNYLRLRVESGILNTRQRLNLEQDNTGRWRQASLEGELAIDDVKVVDKRDNQRLLAWQSLRAGPIRVDLLGMKSEIGRVMLEQPFSRLEIDKEGNTNLASLLLPGVDTREDAGPTPRLHIDEVVTRQGNLRFADRRLSRDFVVDIAALNGVTRNVSNIAGSRSRISLQGKVDSTAPVSIEGSANLLADEPVLDLVASFKSLELTTFTPYSATYAGYAIDRGQVSMTLKYQLQGSRLEGSNDIRITKLKLGEKVESPQAMDIPLKLAIALLSDASGVINLDLKVKGDLNQPDFKIGSLLWNVLGNTLSKAVTSPFSLLASLAGSSESLEEVRFTPGESELAPAQRERIASLAGALRQRPQLGINLRGEVDRKGDLLALQRQQLENQLGKELERSVSLSEIGQDPELQEALESLFESTFNDPLGAQALTHQLVPGSNGAWRWGIETLATQQAVSDKSLRRLATRRAQTIKTMFVDDYDIPPDRVFVLDSQIGGEQGAPRVFFSTESN